MNRRGWRKAYAVLPQIGRHFRSIPDTISDHFRMLLIGLPSIGAASRQSSTAKQQRNSAVSGTPPPGVNNQEAITSLMVNEWITGAAVETEAGPIAIHWQIVNRLTPLLFDRRGVLRHVACDGGGIEHEPILAMIETLAKTAPSSASKVSRRD